MCLVCVCDVCGLHVFCVWGLVCVLLECVCGMYVCVCVYHACVVCVWYIQGMLLNAAWLLAIPPDQGILL